jgi:hypothetical protein
MADFADEEIGIERYRRQRWPVNTSGTKRTLLAAGEDTPAQVDQLVQ